MVPITPVAVIGVSLVRHAYVTRRHVCIYVTRRCVYVTHVLIAAYGCYIRHQSIPAEQYGCYIRHQSIPAERPPLGPLRQLHYNIRGGLRIHVGGGLSSPSESVSKTGSSHRLLYLRQWRTLTDSSLASLFPNHSYLLFYNWDPLSEWFGSLITCSLTVPLCHRSSITVRLARDPHAGSYSSTQRSPP